MSIFELKRSTLMFIFHFVHLGFANQDFSEMQKHTTDHHLLKLRATNACCIVVAAFILDSTC
jgi:hypothetical protein